MTGKCQWERPGVTDGVDSPALQAPSSSCTMNDDVHDAKHHQEQQQHESMDHRLETLPTSSSSSSLSDGNGEYVWVKKRKKTITVVASTQSEWTVVQDPLSKAIYYKNTVTGESQWEEPEVIQKLQHDVQAHTSQQAAKLWEALNVARDTLAQVYVHAIIYIYI
jgi:hypothetical protein